MAIFGKDKYFSILFNEDYKYITKIYLIGRLAFWA